MRIVAGVLGSHWLLDRHWRSSIQWVRVVIDGGRRAGQRGCRFHRSASFVRRSATGGASMSPDRLSHWHRRQPIRVHVDNDQYSQRQQQRRRRRCRWRHAVTWRRRAVHRVTCLTTWLRWLLWLAADSVVVNNLIWWIEWMFSFLFTWFLDGHWQCEVKISVKQLNEWRYCILIKLYTHAGLNSYLCRFYGAYLWTVWHWFKLQCNVHQKLIVNWRSSVSQSLRHVARVLLTG